MQVGSLVKHIELGHIGILTEQGGEEGENWWIYWTEYPHYRGWYTECELEAICK